MKVKKNMKKGMAAVLSMSMMLGLLPIMPGNTTIAKAAAAKTIAGLGTGIIADPTAPASTADEWKGSYVYYGTYNGKPMKYRVLDSETTVFGGTTMLLDYDSSLMPGTYFDDNGFTNEWTESSIRTSLNGKFLTNNFSTAEADAIASSSKTEADSKDGNEGGYFSYAPLSGDKIFLLDAKEATNTSYGYSDTEGDAANRNKSGSYWWLRSPVEGSSLSVCYVYGSDGSFDRDQSNVGFSVSPAFNVNLSSVLFSSVISGTAGEKGAEYKLTLIDSNMTIAVNGDVTQSGDNLTVPYTISGTDSGNMTQISILITDKAYTDNDAQILYYGALDISAGNGTGTFALPSDISEDNYAYIIAEDVNGQYETDYASAPVSVSLHTHTYATELSYDKENHWYASTCGHTAAVKDKEAHTYGEWTSDNNATVASGGTKSRTCSVCNYKQTKLNAGASDFTYDSSTGTVSPASDKDLGTVTTYYKVNNSWTTTKPTTAGTYEVGVVTTESDDYAPAGTADKPFTDSSWKYVIWSCTANDNQITADCGEENVTLTLQASDATYSSSAYNGASLSGTEAWTKAGFTVPTITYVGRGTTAYTESETAPTNVGTYTAKITVEGQTASADFTILKKDPDDISAGAFTKNDETIDGKQDGKITGVSADYEYSTDNGSTWNDCTGSEITGLSSGTVNIRKKATDCYNASNAVDIVIAKGSKIVLSLPEDVNYTVTCSPNEGVTYNGTAVLTFTPSDGYTVTEPLKLTVGGVETEFTKDGAGKYTATVKNITDEDGLKVTAVSGYCDDIKPTGTVKISDKSFTSFLNTITFGIFFKETKQVTIEGADAGSGLKTVSYYIAKNSEAVTESSLGTLNWNVYTESFSIAPSAKYIIYVKLEDNAGNISYLCSDGIVMEDKAPVVTGIERNKTYCEATEFTVTDDYLESVKMDGEDISPINGKYTLPADGTAHTVTAADKAGNVTTIAAVKANDGHTWSAWTSNNDATTEKDGTKTRTCSICGDEDTVTDVGSKIHVHTYDTAWTSDANYHWHAATCGHDTEVSDKATHVYDEWISDNNATATSGGTKSRTCSVCNYKQTKLNASTSDFTCDSSTGTVSPASDKNLGTVTTYYKVNNSWTTTKPTTAGVYEVGVVTTESDDYAPTGTADEPLADSSWKYVVWSCTVDGNIITADCGEKNVSITLQASDETYSGSVYNGARLSGTEAWMEAGFAVPTITYVGRGTTVYAESETAPTNGGNYTAKITVEGQAASVDFTIVKKNQDDISSAAFAKTDETIDGKHDGKITGVSTDYEYSTDGGSTWNDCTGNEITGLASGTVNIRKKETGGYNASNTIDIVIAKGSKIVLSLPEDANYTVTCSPKDGVTYNGTAVLTFTPSDGYTVTEPLKLTVGRVEAEFTKDESTGKYITTVKNITDKDGLKVTAVSGYGESKDIGTVNIPKEKQNGNFAAGGIKNSVTEAKKAVLTDEDKAAMAEGKNVNIWVEVKDQSSTVSDSDKTAVSAKLPTNYVVGAYLDINLWKQITGSDAIKVTQTSNGKLKIGFTIPESLQKTGRDYKIIRLHDGVADVLDVTVDENYELTFETDRFSTYAFIYSDSTTTDDTANTTVSSDTSVSTTAATSPKTGDATGMALYLLMLLAGAAGVAGSLAKRRKECNK